MQIQNADATRIIRDGAKLTLSEGFPQVLLPNVVPVMDMTPRFHRVVNIVRNGTSASTIYAVPSDRDFYLTYASLSAAQAATGTGVSISITVVIDGVTRNLMDIATVSLQACTENVFNSFMPPVKIDRGSNIVLSASGSYDRLRGNIAGYQVEGM